MANNAYKEYEKMLYSYANESRLSEAVVNELFSELLKVLPNNGKLYKYKALSTFHLDELEDKYVWFFFLVKAIEFHSLLTSKIFFRFL